MKQKQTTLTRRKAGHPKRSGLLIRLPIRVETQEQYEQIVNVLSIDQRGALLIAASEKKN